METTTHQLLKLLRQACDKAGGQSSWARANKLSPSYVSDVLLKRRAPGPSIYAALGFVPVLNFRKATQ